MNLKKSVLALVAVSAMGVGMSSAMDIGMVDMNAVMAAYPNVQQYVQKENAIRDQYAPKVQKAMEAVQAQQDKAKQEQLFKDTVLPLEQQAGQALEAVWGDVLKDVHNKIEKVRMEKKLPIVISNPAAVLATEPDTNGVNITPDVVKLVQGK